MAVQFMHAALQNRVESDSNHLQQQQLNAAGVKLTTTP
jgi:hypothetical protein